MKNKTQSKLFRKLDTETIKNINILAAINKKTQSEIIKMVIDYYINKENEVKKVG